MKNVQQLKDEVTDLAVKAIAEIEALVSVGSLAPENAQKIVEELKNAMLLKKCIEEYDEMPIVRDLLLGLGIEDGNPTFYGYWYKKDREEAMQLAASHGVTPKEITRDGYVTKEGPFTQVTAKHTYTHPLGFIVKLNYLYTRPGLPTTHCKVVSRPMVVCDIPKEPAS